MGKNSQFKDAPVSLSCLIALVRTSSTILNNGGKIGHPYLVIYVSEKHSDFHS